ncbi:MAG: hypothetical protein ACJ71W_22210 [Terriglobales bacterium]
MKFCDEMKGMELAENVIEETIIVNGTVGNCATVEIQGSIRDRKGRVWEGTQYVRLRMHPPAKAEVTRHA